MHLLIFEDEQASNFHPLSLTKPVFDLTLGTKTLLERLLEEFPSTQYSLRVTPHLSKITSAKHRVAVNPSEGKEETLFVNGLLRIESPLVTKLLRKKRFAAYSGSHLALARVSSKTTSELLQGRSLALPAARRRLNKAGEKVSLPTDILIRHPWHLVGNNSMAITSQLSKSDKSAKTSRKSFEVVGPRQRLKIERDVLIEAGVVFDTRHGPIHISTASEVQSPARITGPVFIGKGVIVKGARVGGGTTLGDFSRVSGEIENTVISQNSNKAHEGYLGDSYIGEWVNIGSGTTTSNLKNTYGTVRMEINGSYIDTKRNKLGAFLADNSKTAVGTIIYSGVRIGVASHIHGNVIEDVPSFTVYARSLHKHPTELYLKSALETQERMMKRRGVDQTRLDTRLLEDVFELTKEERYSSGVVKREFSLP